MKKIVLSLVAVCATTQLFSRTLVDKIVARVNGVNIMHSILQTANVVTGKRQTLDEAIIDELWVQRAKDRNLTPEESDVEKQVIAMKQANNLMDLSDDEVSNQLLNELGMNLDLYRTMIRRAQAVARAQSQELWGRCTVRAEEVEQYYKRNPVYKVAKYRFRLASLTKKQVEQWANQDKDALSWTTFNWIEYARLAAHLKVLATMKEGEYSQPITMVGGSIVVQLLEAVQPDLVPLDQRYHAIEDMLRQEKMDKASQEMSKDLFKDAIIVKL